MCTARVGGAVENKVNVVHSEMRFVDYLRLIKNETTFQDFRAKAQKAEELEQGSLKDTCCPLETWLFPPK